MKTLVREKIIYMESPYHLMKRNKPTWKDILAAILATFESLFIPLVVIVIALIIVIILFRVLFSS